MIVSDFVVVALEMCIANEFLFLRSDYRCLCKPFLSLDTNQGIYS